MVACTSEKHLLDSQVLKDFITCSFRNSIRAKNIRHLGMQQCVVSLEKKKAKTIEESFEGISQWTKKL